MSNYTINIIDNGLIAGKLSDIHASVTKAVDYLDSFIDWKGSLDIEVNIKTHAQGIEEDYESRYDGDTSKYPDGLLPSILGFTGSGATQKTVALHESITGIDANGANADAGFTIYLGENGEIRNFGRIALFDSGVNYETHSAIASGGFDFASVALHEILHGMGFAIGSGLFSSFLSTQNGVPTFISEQVTNLIGTGIPFQIDGDHYGQLDEKGPVQSGIDFIFGKYDENRWDLGLGDLALLESLGHNVTNKPIGPLFDPLDSFKITGDELPNSVIGTKESQSIILGDGDDTATIQVGSEKSGNDFVDGGAGTDTVIYSGARAGYQVISKDGFTVVRDVNNIDGIDLLTNVELLKFSDETMNIDSISKIKELFAANEDTAKGLAVAYEKLLGGVPNESGFSALINSANSSNFGAGAGVTFNQENIFINLVNNLVQGNASAKGMFDTLATGSTLKEKVTSLYKAIIPDSRESASGLEFITRDEGLKFYQDVAAERGVAGTDGAAIVSLASLLKIAVSADYGVGNAVNDLIKAVAAGNAGLPAGGTTLTVLEVADGTAFDADDTAALARIAAPESSIAEAYMSFDETATDVNVKIIGLAPVDDIAFA